MNADASAGDRPGWLEHLANDTRVGVRAMWRAPAFTIVTVLSLALGLALVACTVAVVNAYLVRSMPYPEADRLYHVNYALQGQREPGDIESLDWRAVNDVAEFTDASAPGRFYLGEGASLVEAGGLYAARGSLEILGLRPALGRSLVAGDFEEDAERVALIGHSLWRSRFGGALDVLGKTLRVRRSELATPFETIRIVGVLPPGFRYAREHARGDIELVVPIDFRWPAYMIRLRKGVAPSAAEQRITAFVSRAASSIPPDWNGIRLESVQARYTSTVRPVLMAITASASLVLVLVCVNVAVLMLLRAMRRQKEVAVRLAMGAGRAHIARLLATEIVVICGAALLGGLALSSVALRALAPLIEQRLGRDAPGGTPAIAVDVTVLLVVLGTGILVAVLLSFVALVSPWKGRLAQVLRGSSRTVTEGLRTSRLRSALIAIEVAVSCALLVGSGLLIRTVVHLVRTDLGFEFDHVERMRVAVPQRTYPDDASLLRFYDQLIPQLASTHGLSFAFSSFLPFYEVTRHPVELEAEAAGDAGSGSAGVLAVSEGYFNLLGIRITRGRGFIPEDRAGTEPVALISETLAKQLVPDGSALGRRIRTAEQPVTGAPATVWRSVVGIVSDVRETYRDVNLADVYVPFLQAPSRFASLYYRAGPGAAIDLAAVRGIGARIDPQVLISGQITGNASLAADAARQLAGPRFLMSMLTGFAIFAVLLAILGVYGTTAYSVQQRQRELAIRIAIGSTHAKVIMLFLKQSGLVLFAGLMLGLAGAVVLARMLENQIFGVRPLDVPTFMVAAAFVVVAAGLATAWPAHNAAKCQPAMALNED
jgi:predicted permease